MLGFLACSAAPMLQNTDSKTKWIISILAALPHTKPIPN